MVLSFFVFLIVNRIVLVDKSDKYIEFESQLQRFCNYQDRCLSEIDSKMLKLEVPENWKSDLLQDLVDRGFLNERRFAKSYAIGKLRNNYWGKQKIYAGLRHKNVSHSIIKESIQTIEEEEYLSILREIMFNKIERIGDIKIAKNKKRLLNYVLQKGYESDIVWQIIKEIELNISNGN